MPKQTIILIHGLGAHPKRWIFFQNYLSNNYVCVALPVDHSVKSFQKYYQLLNNTIKQPVILVGESMGGLIAWNFASCFPGKVKKLVLISPAFQGKLTFKLADYFRIIFQSKKLIGLPFTSADCSRDKTYQNIMKNNPREIRFVQAKYIWQLFIEQIRSRFLRPVCPTLTLLAGQDTMIDVPTAIRIVKQNYRVYPNSRHALSIEINRREIFSDILNWIKR